MPCPEMGAPSASVWWERLRPRRALTASWFSGFNLTAAPEEKGGEGTAELCREETAGRCAGPRLLPAECSAGC